MVRVEARQVRLPDVSFFSWVHFPSRVLPGEQILNMVPDLAVEILSPSNTKKEMDRKRHEYFAGGCKRVWEVDPETRSVEVFTAPEDSTHVDENGTLSGGEVLPGFSVSIHQWFAKVGQRA